MNDTAQFWSGDFGNQYLKRNRVDWRARQMFWGQIMDTTGARSVHEFGCNAGWNLSAIKSVAPYAAVYGNDVNATAVAQAKMCGLNVQVGSLIPHADNTVELVFTSGVLIHVDPEVLQRTIQAIINASSDYVLAVEYASDIEQEVTYRGHTGKLWKRPYGGIYESMGLTLVARGDAGPGFDNCACWLLSKRQA